MQNTICSCGKTLDVSFPEDIIIDNNSIYLEDMKNGTFMSKKCPYCDLLVKPEYRLTVRWPSKNCMILVIPENERALYYHNNQDIYDTIIQTVIGFPELIERISIIDSNLDYNIIEILKYYILMKAVQEYPETTIRIWFNKKDENDIEFHVIGIQDEKVAITKMPYSLYDRIKTEYVQNPKKYNDDLLFNSYFSINNLFRPESEI